MVMKNGAKPLGEVVLIMRGLLNKRKMAAIS